MASDAERKLEALVAQVIRHRESAREFTLAGYDTMAERHQRLLDLVCDEIRRHCLASGLAIPDGLTEDRD